MSSAAISVVEISAEQLMETLAVGDTVWLNLGQGFLQLLGTVFSGVMAYLFYKLKVETKDRALDAAKQVEIVKETLKETKGQTNAKLDEIKSMGDKTHKLVNSGALRDARLYADVARWKATATGDASDIQAAVLAEKTRDDMEMEQRVSSNA